MTHDTEEEARDPVVEQVAEKLRQRSRLGVSKYQTTLARTDLTLAQWLQHAQEEMLDSANYLQVLINNTSPIRHFPDSMRLKPAFATWDQTALARLCNDLWDQNQQLREALSKLHVRFGDDWK